MKKVLAVLAVLICGASNVANATDSGALAETGALAKTGIITASGNSDSDTLAPSSSAQESIEQIRRRIDEIRSAEFNPAHHIPRLVPPDTQRPHHAASADRDRIERLEHLIRLLEMTEMSGIHRSDHLMTIVPPGTPAQRGTRVDLRRDPTEAERDWPDGAADTVFIARTDTVFITTTDTVYADRIQTEIVELHKMLETAVFRAFSVVFEFDSDELLPSSHRILDEVGKLLIDNPEISIEVQGHTDNIGPRDYNLALSSRRAESVRAYILQQFPEIDRERINTAGFGPDRPLMPNETPTQRALNRRVEFIIPDL